MVLLHSTNNLKFVWQWWGLWVPNWNSPVWYWTRCQQILERKILIIFLSPLMKVRIWRYEECKIGIYQWTLFSNKTHRIRFLRIHFVATQMISYQLREDALKDLRYLKITNLEEAGWIQRDHDELQSKTEGVLAEHIECSPFTQHRHLQRFISWSIRFYGQNLLDWRKNMHFY